MGQFEVSVDNTYDYDAYGSLIASIGITDNSYRYTGEQLDSNLNQYYLRARYYNPRIGRFTTQDTWMGSPSDPVTLHKYADGNVDPANHTDPSGHFGLMEFGAANNIAMELMSLQVDVGTSLLDVAFSGPQAPASVAVRCRSRIRGGTSRKRQLQASQAHVQEGARLLHGQGLG